MSDPTEFDTEAVDNQPYNAYGMSTDDIVAEWTEIREWLANGPGVEGTVAEHVIALLNELKAIYMERA